MMLKCVPPLITSSEHNDKEAVSMPLKDIQEVPCRQIGEFVLKLPLPPGTLHGVWQNPDRLFSAYLNKYPGYYCTGDTGFRDEFGCIHIMSRVDDIINVSGHRLSTAAIEQVIAGHECVAECAVIGVDHSLKGQVPVGVVVRKIGFTCTDLESEIKEKVRNQIGAVVAYHETVIVDKLYYQSKNEI